MKIVPFCLFIGTIAVHGIAGDFPTGVNTSDPLLQIGCLDVTKTPYQDDPTGTADSTQAIQRTVNQGI